MSEVIKLFPGDKFRVIENFTKFTTDWMTIYRDEETGALTGSWTSTRGSGQWDFPNDEYNPSDYSGGLIFEFQDGYTRCETVGDLKKAIADLPDDMPVGKWDGDYSMIYSWVNGAPSTVYTRDGIDTIYGGYDPEDPEPTKKMLVI